jgi:protein arginine kinase
MRAEIKMKFEHIIKSVPNWLNPEGPESAIVISSRARLARNVAGFPYVHRLGDEKLNEVVATVLEAAQTTGFVPVDFFRNEDLGELHKNLFIERHLISPSLAEKTANRGVIVLEGERCSILVNEEDHLRIQSIRSGFNPMGSWEDVDSIDDRLSRALEFSFSRDYGYLTTCPTNFGTGLRVSVLIHLPALVLTKEIQQVIDSAGQIGLAVRGYYGEGSDVVGNLFQISNQVSLGRNEREIVDGLVSTVKKVIEYEKNSAATLMNEAKSQVMDKIWRSIGILKSARMLSTSEFMNLSSAVRLGHFLHIIEKPSIESLNELMVTTQPAHLQVRFGRESAAMERDTLRAEMVRERFIDVRV